MEEENDQSMVLAEERSRALERTKPGECNLLSFVLPEDIGLSFLEAGWTNADRAEQLVMIAKGEAEGVKPADQLAAIAYCDKVIKEALHTAGLLQSATHRRSYVEGETKYETDIRVMKMIGSGPGDPNDAEPELSEDDEEEIPQEDDRPQEDDSEE